MSFLKVINIQNPSNANASIIINSVGNVGIGSSTPAVALDVTGSTNISGNLSVSGTATLANPSISGNINTTGTLTVGGNLSVGGINTQISSSNTNLAGNLTVGSNLLTTGTLTAGNIYSNNNVFGATVQSSGTALLNSLVVNTSITTGTLTSSGNLTFTGTGNRITGDFSNGTIASRVIFQTTTANSNTALSVIPNGTAVTGAFQAYGNSDPTNSSYLDLAGVGTTDVRISSSYRGTGTYLPMTFYTGGSERMRIDSSGNVGINTSSPSKKLEVYANANSLQILSVVRNDNTGTGVAAIGFNTSSFAASEATSTKAGIGLVRSNFFGGGALAFYNNNSGVAGDFTTADEKMRITSAGAVGISTTTVTSGGLLAVGGNTPSVGKTMVVADTGGISLALTDATAGTNGSLYVKHQNPVTLYTDSGQNLGFGLGGTTVKMLMTTNSNLLIGTTTVPASGNSTLVINGLGTNAGGVEYVNQNNGGGNVQALSSGGLQWGTFTGAVGSEVYSAKLTLGASGILGTYYTSSTSLTTFNVAQNVIGGLHFATQQGTSTSAKAEAAITFGYNLSLTNAQAGIYVTNDTSSGTAMALATTDNYATGPQIGLSIANNGGVNVPRTWLTVPNQPAWHAYYTGTADLAITIGTTTFTYNIASVNNGSNYSTSSGRFTAPVAGTYYVYAQVQYAAIVAPSFTGLYITKNGSLYVDGYTQNTGYSEPGVRATITLAAGDYLQVVANYSVSASASVIQLSAGTRNYFGGYLIG